MKKTIYIACIVVCILCLSGCQTSSVTFVQTVNDSLEVILPRYNDYISTDTQFDAEQVTAILKSTNELKAMVEEELARLQGEESSE